MLDKTPNGGRSASVGFLPDLTPLSMKELLTLDMALRAAADGFASVENAPRCNGEVEQVVFDLIESCNVHRATVLDEVRRRGRPASNDGYEQDDYVKFLACHLVDGEEFAEAAALLSAHVADTGRAHG